MHRPPKPNEAGRMYPRVTDARLSLPFKPRSKHVDPEVMFLIAPGINLTKAALRGPFVEYIQNAYRVALPIEPTNSGIDRIAIYRRPSMIITRPAQPTIIRLYSDKKNIHARYWSPALEEKWSWDTGGVAFGENNEVVALEICKVPGPFKVEIAYGRNGSTHSTIRTVSWPKPSAEDTRDNPDNASLLSDDTAG